MLIIYITFIYFPEMASDINRLLGMQSIYRRNAYVNSEIQHVVVTGNISIQSIRDFTTELSIQIMDQDQIALMPW